MGLLPAHSWRTFTRKFQLTKRNTWATDIFLWPNYSPTLGGNAIINVYLQRAIYLQVDHLDGAKAGSTWSAFCTKGKLKYTTECASVQGSYFSPMWPTIYKMTLHIISHLTRCFSYFRGIMKNIFRKAKNKKNNFQFHIRFGDYWGQSWLNKLT